MAVVKSILKKIQLADGEVLAVDKIRIGSYPAATGAVVNVRSQFGVVRSAFIAYTPKGQKDNFRFAGTASPGTVTVYATRYGTPIAATSSGGTQLANNTRVTGTFHLWVLGQTR
jgi:hypothetical protein